MNWYVLLDGQQTGPLTDDQIKQMIYSGQIRANDLVWNENLPQWVEAGSVRGLFDPGDQIPVSSASSLAAGQKKNTGLIIALAILIVLLIIIAGLLVRFFFFNDSDETTTLTTEAMQTTTSESEQTLKSTTEADSVAATTESAGVTEPAVTTTAIETETETEAEVTTGETDADSAISQAEILYVIHMADLTALGYFREAFETELDGGTKAPFEDIRPALLEYWSVSMVDDELYYFYDENLVDWGYEMVQIFPFHDMEILEESFVDILSQDDQEIIVHTYIAESMMYDGYPLDVVLIYEDGRWVVNEYYSGDID